MSLCDDRKGRNAESRTHRARLGRVLVGLLVAAVLALAGTTLLAALGLRYFFEERAALRLEPVFDARFRDANAALAAPAGPRLVVFGDSRAAQLGFPAVPGWEVVDRAIGGESTAQMRYRFPSDVLALSPRAVVLFAGINDLMAAAALPARRQAGLDAAVTNLARFVEEARAAGIEVILLTIVRPAAPRLIRRPIWPEGVHALVSDANERLRRLAGPGVTLVDADALLAGDDAPEDTTPLPWSLARDEVHLNAEANARLREAILAALPSG